MRQRSLTSQDEGASTTTVSLEEPQLALSSGLPCSLPSSLSSALPFVLHPSLSSDVSSARQLYTAAAVGAETVTSAGGAPVTQSRAVATATVHLHPIAANNEVSWMPAAAADAGQLCDSDNVHTLHSDVTAGWSSVGMTSEDATAAAPAPSQAQCDTECVSQQVSLTSGADHWCQLSNVDSAYDVTTSVWLRCSYCSTRFQDGAALGRHTCQRQSDEVESCWPAPSSPALLAVSSVDSVGAGTQTSPDCDGIPVVLRTPAAPATASSATDAQTTSELCRSVTGAVGTASCLAAGAGDGSAETPPAGSSRLQCPICGQIQSRLFSLRQHVKSHLVNGVYSCPFCEDRKFAAYSRVRKHIRSVHSSRVFQCCVCQKSCPSADKLKLHLLKHSDKREFLCAICGRQFKRKDKLKDHVRRMHVDQRGRHSQCPSAAGVEQNSAHSEADPAAGFSQRASARCSNYQSFLYKCRWCRIGFKRRGMLINHLATRHVGYDPQEVPELLLPLTKMSTEYGCHFCDKVYRSNSKRKSHILKHHPEAGLVSLSSGTMGEALSCDHVTGCVSVQPHSCSWCHRQYASRAKLLQHERKQHLHQLSAPSAPITGAENVCSITFTRLLTPSDTGCEQTADLSSVPLTTSCQPLPLQ